ncbi:TauD/TfdA family dioxygenase [Streptomyces sp. NPDC058391]|uniref:TauD/TfdA family dioxygenase n=1 Tax=Streptomyces sp. NPDC058391 TaxID=3346476 RepID=UPI00364F3DD5
MSAGDVRGAVPDAAPGIRDLSLTEQAARECAAVLDAVGEEFDAADDPRFLRKAGDFASRLPAGVRDAVQELRYAESVAALVIRGGPVRGADGPTPAHWKERDPAATVRQDFWLALVTARLGDPIGWSSLQDGRLFNDMLPIEGEELQQTGHSSEADLELHIEDCFSDERCDALALLCLRNHDRVPSSLVTTAALDLGRLDVDTLFSPRFLIMPDAEHLRRTGDTPESAARLRPVMFGSRHAPYLRVDLPYTRARPGDERAARALEKLAEQLGRGATTVNLDEGDLLLVDNYRALHGRGTFQPRYDGTDRWMRRLTVVRDLRRSRGLRGGADDRVIDPFAPLMA